MLERIKNRNVEKRPNENLLEGLLKPDESRLLGQHAFPVEFARAQKPSAPGSLETSQLSDSDLLLYWEVVAMCEAGRLKTFDVLYQGGATGLMLHINKPVREKANKQQLLVAVTTSLAAFVAEEAYATDFMDFRGPARQS